jgi:type IV pilus assembly protein PilN
MVGYAQSNARVSTLMRNVEASPWIAKPELVEIKLVTLPGATRGAPSQQVNEFTLNFLVKRASPASSAPAPAAAKPGAPAPAKAAASGAKA